MSKGNSNGKFTNRAARRFKDKEKVDTIAQSEIFEILDEDMPKILEQVTAFREHRQGAQYPAYLSNGFANLSTVLYFKNYVDDHVQVKKKHGKVRVKTDLSSSELESLRSILADAYKKSATGFYNNQIQEFADRNELLSQAFKRLCPEIYQLTAKLDGLSKSQRRDLTIQLYGDPVYNFKFIHKKMNEATISDKKKLKFLQRAYGKKRFVKAVGAAMTVESNNSDCLAVLFDFMQKLKKKNRAKYIRAYAEAYKRNKSRYFRIDKDFYDGNKRIIKELKMIDVGYKKAFKDLKGGKNKGDKGFKPNRPNRK